MIKPQDTKLNLVINPDDGIISINNRKRLNKIKEKFPNIEIIMGELKDGDAPVKLDLGTMDKDRNDVINAATKSVLGDRIDNLNKPPKFPLPMVTGLIGFLLGVGACFLVYTPRIKRYEQSTNSMLLYLSLLSAGRVSSGSSPSEARIMVGLSAVPFTVTARLAFWEYVPPCRISSSPALREFAMRSNSSFVPAIAGRISCLTPEAIPLLIKTSSIHAHRFIVRFIGVISISTSS